MNLSQLLEGRHLRFDESLDQLTEQLVQLVGAGELREVTLLRFLLDSPRIWLPNPHYFCHWSGAKYRFMSYTRIQEGSFARVHGVPVDEITEIDHFTTFEESDKVRQWLKSALLTRLLDEVTLLATWGTPEFRHLYSRVFETKDGDYFEVRGSDGPLAPWYGRLDDFDRLPEKSKLWQFRESEKQ